ncbi:MAG TPA: DbpA RNA binding domain-containing protein, partial [Polyangiaceae bacterium]
APAPRAAEPSAPNAAESAPRAAEPSAPKPAPRAPASPERIRADRDRPRREPLARSNGRSHSSELDDLPRYTVSEASASDIHVAAPPPVERELSAADLALRERSEDGDFAPAREGVAEIYVSIGRRDGARPSDIQTILEQNGLNSEQTDYIRVRQRNSFVGVKTEYLEKAVSALNGAAIAGKPAFAEPARQRD